MAGRLGRRAGLALLAGSLLWVGAAFLTTPSLFEGVDYWLEHRPNKVYLARALGQGRLPLWNPHVGLGRPFLADIETATLYPPSLAYAAMDPDAALAFLTWLHVALGAWGMWRLARHLGADDLGGAVAALAWGTSSLVAGRLYAGQLGYAQALAYLPVVLWLAARLQDRRDARGIAALGAAVALQLLCGHPQAWWLSLLGAGLLVVGRDLGPPWRPAVFRLGRSVALLGSGVGLGLGLAAVQVLPTLELAGQSNRSEPSLAFSAFVAMHWRSFVALGLPEGIAPSGHWESNLYGGVVAAVGGLVGLALVRDRDSRGLAFMAITGGVIALGTHTPVFALAERWLPGLSAFRLPLRAAVLAAVALPPACGRLIGRRSGPGAARVVALGGGLAAALAVAAPGLGGPALQPRHGVQAALAVAGCGLLAACVSRRRAWLAAALLAVMAVDALHAADLARRTYAFTSQRRDLLEPQEERIVERMRRLGLFPADGTPPRISLPPTLMREDGGLVHGHSTYTGYGSLSLERVWVTIHAALGLDVPRLSNTYPSEEILERGPFPFDTMSLVLGWDPGTRRVVARATSDPRAYLVERTVRVAGLADAVSRLAAGFDVHRAALVETPLALPEPSDEPADDAAARIVSFEPERLRLEVRTDVPALLVVGEAWYPGWSAKVDGVPAPCMPVNAWMRGVPLPAGAREVELTYRSRPLLLGAALSLLGLGALVVLGRRPRLSP